jgi:hypothetical protein
MTASDGWPGVGAGSRQRRVSAWLPGGRPMEITRVRMTEGRDVDAPSICTTSPQSVTKLNDLKRR